MCFGCVCVNPYSPAASNHSTWWRQRGVCPSSDIWPSLPDDEDHVDPRSDCPATRPCGYIRWLPPTVEGQWKPSQTRVHAQQRESSSDIQCPCALSHPEAPPSFSMLHAATFKGWKWPKDEVAVLKGFSSVRKILLWPGWWSSYILLPCTSIFNPFLSFLSSLPSSLTHRTRTLSFVLPSPPSTGMRQTLTC